MSCPVLNNCPNPIGNIAHLGPTINNTSSTVLTLVSVITYLKWSSVCVVFDNATEHEAIDLQKSLSTIGIFAVLYRMEEVTSSKIDALSLNEPNSDPDRLNFTVLCRLSSCQSFLEKPFDFGRKHVWRNSLLYFSSWLVGIFDTGNLTILENNSSCAFDNIAIIKYPTIMLKSQQQQQAVKAAAHDCEWFPIQTLMWHKKGRGLLQIGFVHLNGSLIKIKDIFPNARFGYNQRKLLISTLPWPPFVILDNKTKQYSGITIELLKELSYSLNFTYEIKPPPDGKWGVGSDNNTWNGMIGQLQRREIDMIAAPLGIQSHRETVMDFTHPYYYEFSAILMKKPNPNDTRWATLLDPFSPKVLMYIGISLPVVSLFLVAFEKYNPFYGYVQNRMQTRGLHHFSDSFWYMYGALLTQGGEHIARSSAGRTLLSFWWIFCIIMVATYSGNFVAFLTVSKTKLPFTNLEGLVAQSSYKWGTAGATIYETIFKNSELEERKELWRGIITFNATDPSVLSSDPEVHVTKVLKGEYAYVADKTFMDLAMTNNCDLAIATSDILPVQYAIGLPNNSSFVQMFSDEIIAILESGLIQIWTMQIWPRNGVCQKMSVTEAKTIELVDIQIAFYLIGLGVGLACLSLFYEFLRNKFCQWLRRSGRMQRRIPVQYMGTRPNIEDFFSSNINDSPMNRAISQQIGNSWSHNRQNESNVATASYTRQNESNVATASHDRQNESNVATFSHDRQNESNMATVSLSIDMYALDGLVE
ncbi:unnamed protein product [Mytilus coruscus]|uniref:GRIN n=1 Tax=Mytilus coruscus TaxID=42192 RepID=A0A6J8DH36_MYTCO|nr:unnamed protein product [Mytilus coruscus]